MTPYKESRDVRSFIFKAKYAPKGHTQSWELLNLVICLRSWNFIIILRTNTETTLKLIGVLTCVQSQLLIFWGNK
jgi:hypothetical protein